MPNISSITDIPSFLTFFKDLFFVILDSIKFLYTYIVGIFDVTYYASLFNSLPSPFNTILVSLVSLVLTIVLLKVISLVGQILKFW